MYGIIFFMKKIIYIYNIYAHIMLCINAYTKAWVSFWEGSLRVTEREGQQGKGRCYCVTYIFLYYLNLF